jgi:hypothetical protein
MPNLPIAVKVAGSDYVSTEVELQRSNTEVSFKSLGSAIDEFTKSILLLDGEDASTTISDSVGVISWSASGNAKLSTAVKKFGTASLALDGTGDYIYASDSSSFTLGSGNWTFDVWVKRTATGALDRLLGQCNTGATSTTISIISSINADNTVGCSVCSGATYYSFASSLTVGTDWTYISIERYGNTATIYVDGVASGTKDLKGVTINDSVNQFAIGRIGEYNDANNFDGYIDDFMFSVGTARHMGNFTPPTVPIELVNFPELSVVSLLPIDSGSNSTIWDMSTFSMATNPNGESGTVLFKYAYDNTGSTIPDYADDDTAYNSTWLTLAQLQAETDVTDGILRIACQLSGNGSQDATITDASITATMSGSGGGSSKPLVFFTKG